MGVGSSTFRREDLEVYEACTCLSGAEILELYEKFTDLGGVREADDETEKIVRGAGAALRLSAAQDAWWSVDSGVHWASPPSLQPFRLCVQYASEDGACGLLLFAFD